MGLERSYHSQDALLLTLGFGGLAVAVLSGYLIFKEIKSSINNILPVPAQTQAVDPLLAPILIPTTSPAPTPTSTGYRSNIIYMKDDDQYYVRDFDQCILPPVWGGDVTIGAKAIGDPTTNTDGWPITIEVSSGIKKTFNNMDELTAANIGNRWLQACSTK